jgi:hypothetical protein
MGSPAVIIGTFGSITADLRSKHNPNNNTIDTVYADSVHAIAADRLAPMEAAENLAIIALTMTLKEGRKKEKELSGKIDGNVHLFFPIYLFRFQEFPGQMGCPVLSPIQGKRWAQRTRLYICPLWIKVRL